MRTLDAALTAKQKEAKRTPYLRIYFDNRAGTTYTFTTRDTTNRIMGVDQWEEGYAGVAVVRLSNYDQYFSSRDLRGYSVSVGWGMELTGSPGPTWYSNAAPMKVKLQRDISQEGVLITEFYCLSKWAEIESSYIMAAGKRLTGTIVRTGNTISLGETLTGSISGATGRLAIIGTDFVVVTRVTGTFQAAENAVGTTVSVNTITAVADNYGPLVYKAGDTATSDRIASLLTGLVTGITVDEDDPDANLAASPYMAYEAGTEIRAIIRQMLLKTKCGARYCNDDRLHILYLDTSDAAQYEFDSSHAFFTDLREQALIMPNTVIFVDILPSTTEGVAATYIGTANDSVSVAKMGTFYTIEVDQGIASNADATKRAEAWIAHMVAEAYQGGITAPMECGLEVYDVSQAVDTRLGITAKGRVGRLERVYEPATGTYEIRLRLGSLYSTPGAMDVGPDSLNSDLQGLSTRTWRDLPTIPDSRSYPIGAQAYIANLALTSVDWDDISWTAGTVKLQDGRTQVINAGTLHLTGTHYLYVIWGNTTLQNSTTYGDAVGEDRFFVGVAKKGSSSAVTAYVNNPFGSSILVNRDAVMDGLVGELQLAALAVTEAKIAATAVTEGKIAALAVTAGKIAALAVSADKIAANAVTADKIYAGSVTAIKIDAAAIDATKLAATIVLSTIIWAGTAVKLDSTGISIYSDISTLAFRIFQGVLYSYFFLSSGGDLNIVAPSGKIVLTTAVGKPIQLAAVKTTTGNPSSGTDGDFIINTYDNNIKINADGNWHTIASW